MMTMREVKTHHVNTVNSDIHLFAVEDHTNPGGAPSCYRLVGYNVLQHPDYEPPPENIPQLTEMYFQLGNPSLYGANGLTQETLIAILIDRLECFQSGEYRHDSNARALVHLRAARDALLERTRERILRGVEGTHTP